MTDVMAGVEIAEWGDWKARDYLAEFYSVVEPDCTMTVEFLVEALQRLPQAPVARALDFGTGPALYTIFSLAPVAQEIHLAEYLPDNRAALTAWKEQTPAAYDWADFVADALKLEGVVEPTVEQIHAREAETRAKITEIVACDAALPDPMGPERRETYPLVTTHYCAEGATDDKATWRIYMGNIATLVAPGGMLVISGVREMTAYPVGEEHFPAANVTAAEMLAMLEDLGFINIDLRVREVPFRAEQGFTGLIFASGFKPGA